MQFSKALIKSKAANTAPTENASTKRRSENDADKPGNEPADTSSSAPWRVENLRTGGAPVESDWWVDGEQPQKKKNKSIFACFEEDPSSRGAHVNSSNNHVGIIPFGDIKTCQASMIPAVLMGGGSSAAPACGDFQNCGLSTWEKVRKEWSTQTVEERPAPPPALAKYESVKAGLSQVRRTYELPGRMTLPDIVDLYVDVWEAGEQGDIKMPSSVGGIAQETIGAVFCRSKGRRRRQAW